MRQRRLTQASAPSTGRGPTKSALFQREENDIRSERRQKGLDKNRHIEGLLLVSLVIPATSLPRWYAEEGASISINSSERTAHSARFWAVRSFFPCGPPLKLGVRRRNSLSEEGSQFIGPIMERSTTMAHLSEIWSCIRQFMPRRQWVSLQEIYGIVEERLTLDAEDFTTGQFC